MTTRTSTYPLRLPRSLKAAVEKISKRDGTSLNQFVVMAVAEKVSAMTTAEYFAERRQRADWRPSIAFSIAKAASRPVRATHCRPYRGSGE